MRIKTVCVLAASVLIAACTIGQNAEEWGVARSVAGAKASVIASSATINGELIEVRRDGVVMLRTDHTLAYIPFTAIRGMELTGLGSDYIVNASAPMTEVKRAQFAVLSHFPQGMPPAARDQLLAASGQKEITVIE